MELTKGKNSKYLLIVSTFDSRKNNKITLGRLPANGIDVAFNEESTSRMQCTYVSILFYLEYHLKITIGMFAIVMEQNLV
jgi:hypothetical protein